MAMQVLATRKEHLSARRTSLYSGPARLPNLASKSSGPKIVLVENELYAKWLQQQCDKKNVVRRVARLQNPKPGARKNFHCEEETRQPERNYIPAGTRVQLEASQARWR